jgi:flagellar assembly factor FliW
MPGFETEHFGQVPLAPEVEFEFPCGLPGFDERRRFMPLRFERSDPLIFLQSLEDPGLCFITVPVLVADPAYRLEMEAEDLEAIGLDGFRQPRIGEDVMCLAVVSARPDGPTANLLAPVVVNLRNRRAVQAVAAARGYSHQHPLVSEESAVCS